MPDGIRIPTLQEHYIDAQDQTPLPIWRPEAYFKYPDGGDLETEEILRLLELFRSCLLGKRAVQGVVKRTKDNIHEFQRDTYLFFGPSPLPFGGSTVLETYSSTTSRSRPRTRGVAIRG
jgi:hypothetical protein